MKLNYQFQIALRLAVRQCMKALWIFPVKRHKILFESYNGTAYSCNPKYLSEYLETNYPLDYQLVWSVEDPSLFSELQTNHKVQIVRKRSLRWYYEYLTAGVRVVNVATQMTFFPKRKHQLVINTWHAGGAYKRTGIISEHVQASNDFQKWRRRMQAAQFDLFLSSSPVFTETNIRAAYGYRGKVLESGQPRNDLFFDTARVQKCSEKVRKELGVSGLLVLYAPTYRGSTYQSSPLPEIPVSAIAEGVKARYGCLPTILIRAHYTDQNQLVPATTNNGEFPIIKDVTSYPDMQELLCAANLLVTDYSSSIWDFALLGRPSILYVPDLDFYETTDRGFFTPINEWPGIVCRDTDELKEALRTLNEDYCRDKANRHLEQFQSYEQGHACEKTEDVIRHFIKTGELV